MDKIDDEMQTSSNTPQWLKTIQLNSWEAELLVSALVLYGLFQVPEYLYEFSYNTFSRDSGLHDVFRLVRTSIKILQLGYASHILIRGMWVASIGFSYVFPNGIRDEKLGFKGKFKDELKKNRSLVKNVLRLEELSSMIYGTTFTFFGLVLGTGLLSSFFIAIEHFLSPHSPDAIINSNYLFAGVLLIFSFLSVAVFVDFVTGGLLRKKDWSVDWYYYVAKVFRILTLSFIYRRSLLVLSSNLAGWKSRLFTILLALLVVGFSQIKGQIESNAIEKYYESSASGSFTRSNYDGLRKDGDYYLVTIPSDIISSSFLKINLKEHSIFRQFFDSAFDPEQIKWLQLSSDSTSYYLNKWLEISVDKEVYHNLSWQKSQHPDNLEFGFHTYLDLKEIPRGPHTLTVKIDTASLSKNQKYVVKRRNFHNRNFANILFTYDR